MRWTALVANLLLIAFLACLAIAAAAQVRHNVANHHPRDRPVATHSATPS
jgi:TRAP-type C4-dicarboxylate transport system permease small subunit